MKLLLPFKVGDVVRNNYDSPRAVSYRIVGILSDCTCANYVDQINNGDRAQSREPHVHFTCVLETEPETKSGKYPDHAKYYLGPSVYRNGECVSVDGPYEKWMTGWHKEDNGLDKILLVRLAPNRISQLTKPTTKQPRSAKNEKNEE